MARITVNKRDLLVAIDAKTKEELAARAKAHRDWEAEVDSYPRRLAGALAAAAKRAKAGDLPAPGGYRQENLIAWAGLPTQPGERPTFPDELEGQRFRKLVLLTSGDSYSMEPEGYLPNYLGLPRP